MVRYHFFAAALVATVSSVPLNINLGAYSPALVVGDGEISFGGNQDVTSLMNALEGAAVNAAGAKTSGAAAGGAAAAPSQAAAAAPVGAPVAAPVAAAEVPTAPKPADAVAPTSASSDTATTTDSSLNEQAAQISTLQGMGKEIAPRDPVIADAPKDKRDLAGFDRALQFAENALTKGPVVQLGTGEGPGAGVGIIVDNRPTGGAAAGAAPAGGGKKRDESGIETAQPRRRAKITTMYIRRGAPDSFQTHDLEARDVKTIPTDPAATKERRDEEVQDMKRDAIDSINLNIDDPQGVTMTFVET